MTNDNEDALRCAEWLEASAMRTDIAASVHLRRLVREIEELRADVEHKDAFATQLGRDLMAAQREIEAKDALLRQAVGALEFHQDQTRPIYGTQNAIAAIRQHLDQKTT